MRYFVPNILQTLKKYFGKSLLNYRDDKKVRHLKNFIKDMDVVKSTIDELVKETKRTIDEHNSNKKGSNGGGNKPAKPVAGNRTK